MKKIFHKILNLLRRIFYSAKQRKRLKNTSFSLFSSNCVGCCVLHDLGLQFTSPFVNLFLNAKDYLKYLHDPQKYNVLEFEEIEPKFGYPMAMLGDLTFHFVHYKSFDDAVSAFKRRNQRVNYNNLFVIFSEADGCTYEDLKEFDGLPYKNKVVFTHLPYEDIKSSFYIKGFENDVNLGNLVSWTKKPGKRIYDQFDFVSWFNNHCDS